MAATPSGLLRLGNCGRLLFAEGKILADWMSSIKVYYKRDILHVGLCKFPQNLSPTKWHLPAVCMQFSIEGNNRQKFSLNKIGFELKGWMTRQFFWLIKISVSQNLPESNKSPYWAGGVVKNTVKSWNSQMNFHSVEIFPRDVNCRKRHHSGSTLLHMRACAIGSQSLTSKTLSHFWLLGSKYQSEMGPKTKTNTYEFTVFSLVLTLSLPRNRSEWY